jgi:hypothetical protein
MGHAVEVLDGSKALTKGRLVLPSNPVLKKLALVLAITCSLGYAWLSARMGEPSDRVPRSFVSDVLVLDQGKASTLRELRGIFFHETHRALGELKTVEPTIAALGGLRSPLLVVIDMDHPFRFVNLSDRIVIGSKIVLAEGQLAKSVLKSWLLQNARPEIRASHLRLEVASDVMLAFSQGYFELSTPESGLLTYDGAQNWTRYANTYSGFCSSPWMALELRELCLARNISKDAATPTLLSFRPLIGQMIWDGFQSQSALKRVSLFNAWIASLTHDDLGLGVSASESKTVVARIADEIEAVLPRNLGVAVDSTPLSKDLKLDLLVDLKSDAGVKTETVLDAVSMTRSMLVREDGYVSPPSTVVIEKNSVNVSSKTLAVIGCAAPTVRDVITKMGAFQKVVFIRSCESGTQSRLHLASLARAGVFGFASMNPDAEFIQFRPHSVALALKTGVIREDQTIDRLLEMQTSNSLLGLDRSTWIDNVRAFKVSGAIEAIEWYRLGTNTSI